MEGIDKGPTFVEKCERETFPIRFIPDYYSKIFYQWTAILCKFHEIGICERQNMEWSIGFWGTLYEIAWKVSSY